MNNFKHDGSGWSGCWDAYVEWLQSLQPGDTWQYVCSGSYGLWRDVRTLKVDKITATQIVIGSSRYKRSNGQMVGNRRKMLPAPVSDAAIAKVHEDNLHRNLAYVISQAQWDDLSIDQLKRIESIIKE